MPHIENTSGRFLSTGNLIGSCVPFGCCCETAATKVTIRTDLPMSTHVLTISHGTNTGLLNGGVIAKSVHSATDCWHSLLHTATGPRPDYDPFFGFRTTGDDYCTNIAMLLFYDGTEPSTGRHVWRRDDVTGNGVTAVVYTTATFEDLDETEAPLFNASVKKLQVDETLVENAAGMRVHYGRRGDSLVHLPDSTCSGCWSAGVGLIMPGVVRRAPQWWSDVQDDWICDLNHGATIGASSPTVPDDAIQVGTVQLNEVLGTDPCVPDLNGQTRPLWNMRVTSGLLRQFCFDEQRAIWDGWVLPTQFQSPVPIDPKPGLSFASCPTQNSAAPYRDNQYMCDDGQHVFTSISGSTAFSGGDTFTYLRWPTTTNDLHTLRPQNIPADPRNGGAQITMKPKDVGVVLSNFRVTHATITFT